MSNLRRLGSKLKRWRDRVTHEVPIGPHTDVKRRKINPSFQKRIKKIKMPPPRTDIRKTLTDAFAGGIKGKPHSSPSGRAASVGRTIKRMGESRAAPKKIKIDSNIVKTKNWPFAKGGDVTRFRSSGPEGKPHSTKEGRSAEAQRAYMRKFGPQEPRRKRIWPKRAKHGIGSLVKKIITKIKPKPKPKGKGLGSGIKPSEAKDILKSDKITRSEYLKQWSPYFGGRSLKKEMKAGEGVHARNKESKKVFKSAKGKAAGGRIGLRHGGSVGAAKRGHGAEIK